MTSSIPAYLNNRILGAIIDPEHCEECKGRRDGVQVYSSVRLRDMVRLAWDVELALQICTDGREAEYVDPSQIAQMLQANQVNPMHLDHVDPTIPGIACVMEYAEDRRPVICLIDGCHRAARCLRDNVPFYIYTLTEQEGLLCQQTDMVRMYLAVHEHQAKLNTGDSSPALFDPNCHECQEKRRLPKVFTFERTDGQVFGWAIDLAIEICSDGRTPLPVPLGDLETILGVNQIDETHLDHVDPSIPGIACACGEIAGHPLLVLIDGAHRAARCLKERRPFLVYILSEEESQRCQKHVPAMLAQFVQSCVSI